MKRRSRLLVLVALLLVGSVMAAAPASAQTTTATLIKQAIPEGPTPFVFTYDGQFPTPLVDDGTPANTAFNGNAPLGTHTWAETVPPGWVSLGASCVNNATGAVLNFPGPSATITWNPGDQWVCTFTNALDPNEPNDSVGTATPAACDFASAGATIVPVGDLDFYGPFTPDPAHLYAGTLLRIDIDAQINGSLLDPMVGVFDSLGNLLAFNDDGTAPGEPFTFDSYLEFVAPSPDSFFIGVTSFADFDFDGVGAITTGPYDLFVECTPFQSLVPPVGMFPDEPNDTPDTATPGVCPAVIESEISPVGDVDFYSISAPPGSQVAVDVDAGIDGSPLDPMIGIWDGPNQIAFNDDGTAPGEPFTFDSYLEFNTPGSGQFLMGVTSFADFEFDGGPNAFSQGFYTINLHCRVTPGLVLEKFTNGVDADQGPGPSIPVGDPVLWTYEVTNTGFSPLKHVLVWDGRNPEIPIPGPASGDDGNGMLDVGETWVYEVTGVAEPGHYANYGAAGASAPDGTRLRHQDWSHYFGELPPIGIAIDAFVNGAPLPEVIVPSDVEFTYEVTNPGVLPLGDIRVIEERAGLLAGPDAGDDGNGLLDPGETWVYSMTDAARFGAQSRGVSASGEDGYGRVATDDTTADYFGGFINLGVRARGPWLLSPGDPYSLTYTVTNTGTIAPEALVIDTLCGPVVFIDGDANGDGFINRGEAWTYGCDGLAGPHGREVHEVTVTPMAGPTPLADVYPRNNSTTWTLFVY